MKAFFESRHKALFVGPMTSNPFPMHVHECVELAYVLRGGCVMRIGEGTYQLGPGDIAVLFPLAPHSFESLEPGTAGFAAMVPPDAISEFTHTFHRMLPVCPVVPAEALSPEVPGLIGSLLSTPNGTYSPLRLGYLHLLLAHVLSALSLRPVESVSEYGLAARAMRYIDEHACENITLESAARGLGISRSHLSHLFSQQLRVNFRQFINGIRINRAITLMLDPACTLTQICDACGYDNMRTFRRAFTRETGVLPSDYRKRLSSASAT